MKRHRIDISSQAKAMLQEIREQLDLGSINISLLSEMCIQSAYENMINGDCFNEELNPTQRKLDEILKLLREALIEV
ncbi:MAG: hypothetical protein NE328_13115 [Lentisphaeraceae bacterium]|nr:hypothetical protein [Lentisphaeraceae bacterium]